MKINDNFSAKWDGRQWILTETYAGKDKAGNPKPQTREFYYPNLRQICKKVIDCSAADCDDLNKHIEVMERACWLLEGKLSGFVDWSVSNE